MTRTYFGLVGITGWLLINLIDTVIDLQQLKPVIFVIFHFLLTFLSITELSTNIPEPLPNAFWYL
jgi:hypothetical protein